MPHRWYSKQKKTGRRSPPSLPSTADQEHEQASADLNEKDMQLECEENAAEESRGQPLTVAGFEAALAEEVARTPTLLLLQRMRISLQPLAGSKMHCGADSKR